MDANCSLCVLFFFSVCVCVGGACGWGGVCGEVHVGGGGVCGCVCVGGVDVHL